MRNGQVMRLTGIRALISLAILAVASLLMLRVLGPSLLSNDIGFLPDVGAGISIRDDSLNPKTRSISVRRLENVGIDPKTVILKDDTFRAYKKVAYQPKMTEPCSTCISPRASIEENLSRFPPIGFETNKMLFLLLIHENMDYFEMHPRFDDYFISVEGVHQPFEGLGYCNVIRTGIQNEHTLVKNRAPSWNWSNFVGKVKDDEGNPFLVRIKGIENFPEMDMIIEYSMPNIQNMKMSGLFDQVTLDKIVYVPPINQPYDARPSTPDHPRDLDVVVTFYCGKSMPSRRADLVSDLEKAGVKVNFITNLDPAGLQMRDVMDRTKILINVHQNDEHWTLEELRVLPAILRGVVVISETVPLDWTIPYRDKIIFTAYENLVHTVLEVQANYDEHFARIHTEETKLLIGNMQRKAREDINSRLSAIIEFKELSRCVHHEGPQQISI